MEIRKLEQEDIESIKEIIKKLHPAWFDKNALENIPRDIQMQKCFVAEENGQVAGFISLSSKDGEANLRWIGKELLKKAEDFLRQVGIKVLRVETVGETKPYDEPYGNTVKFYKAMGFKLESKSEEKEEKGYKYRMHVLKKRIMIIEE